jgi:formate hydrogenlyase subunit 6/NADH:ubiquinone oxidoreductase subunit I
MYKKCFSIIESGFSVNAQTCSSCQLCVDICPEQAIIVKDHIMKVQDGRYAVYQKTCSVCNEPFETLREQDGKCVPCTKREGLGFLSSR